MEFSPAMPPTRRTNSTAKNNNSKKIAKKTKPRPYPYSGSSEGYFAEIAKYRKIYKQKEVQLKMIERADYRYFERGQNLMKAFFKGYPKTRVFQDLPVYRKYFYVKFNKWYRSATPSERRHTYQKAVEIFKEMEDNYNKLNKDNQLKFKVLPIEKYIKNEKNDSNDNNIIWNPMKWLYTGSGFASDETYDAAVNAASETIGVQVASQISLASEQIIQTIIEKGHGTLQIGISGTAGGAVGATGGVGFVIGYSKEHGWQCGIYTVGGGGSYIGAGGAMTVDVSVSGNDSIYKLGGNAMTIGGSGGTQTFTAGGEVNIPLDLKGKAEPSMTFSAGTLVIPGGTPAEAHVFLTNTQIFGHDELTDFFCKVFYEKDQL